MDKLKVVNREAIDLGESFGIPIERLNQISQGLDDMVKLASAGTLKLVYAVDIFKHIESLCNTDEEFIWAIQNHILWAARTGRLFTTKEAQEIAINKFGQPQNLQK